MTDPLSIDRFIVRLDNDASGQFVIAERDLTPISSDTAEAILADRDPAVIWHTSDRYGYIVFPTTDEGWGLAERLCDQLNAADAENDAAQAEEEARAEAELDAAPDLTAEQRRGLAAYQRAVSAGIWYRGEPAVNFGVGERITIGHVPPTDYERGVLCALDVPWWAQGATATVILPAAHRSEMIVLLDDRDDVVALPSFMLYVRRAGGEA